MLASCAQPVPAQHAEGSCDEDFVKSFIPSLFDSDSDAEDGCSLQSPHARTLPEAASLELPQSLRHLHVLRRSASTAAGSEGSPEASSPSSAGGASCLSAFNLSALAGDVSCDEAPGFQSLLSLSSAASALTVTFEDERPAKKARVGDAADSGSPLASALSSGSLPRNSSLSCLVPALMSSAALGVSSAPQLPLPPAPWVTSPVPPPTPCCELLPPAADAWPGSQGLIPTAPITASYTRPPPVPPAAPSAAASEAEPEAVTGGELAAALAELDCSLAPPPLGLKLDKAGVAAQLRALGMILTDAP